jgi:hypothetical protein
MKQKLHWREGYGNYRTSERRSYSLLSFTSILWSLEITVLQHSVVHMPLLQGDITWIKYEDDTTCAWQQVDSLSWCYQYRSENISEATSGNACSSLWSLCSEVFNSTATLMRMDGTNGEINKWELVETHHVHLLVHTESHAVLWMPIDALVDREFIGNEWWSLENVCMAAMTEWLIDF